VEAPESGPGFGQRPTDPGPAASLASYGRWVWRQHSLEQAATDRSCWWRIHVAWQPCAALAAPLLGDHLLGVIQIGVGGGVYQPRLRPGGRGAPPLRFRPGWLGRLAGNASIRSPLIADRRAALGLLGPAAPAGGVREIQALTGRLQVCRAYWIAQP